ncbi:hypothetical protein BD410DRAFT_785422 [Rickenella mellea]|uniref:Translocation protein sec66 n=1 Tax=Rickenella mellea TaxID=50990 RepID=A0A4Y7QAV6_9AGAM|nr:hypothetical protein BD410DRAFT_785422 [Rickenella mellea]
MASILVPVLYLTLVIGSLFIFSYFYRKRKAATRLEPWFPSHPERNTYVTLLQLTSPPASDSLLKAALIRRAMADVTRVLYLREAKPALQALLQKGSIGEELWNSFLQAEKEMEAEIVEVMYEANTFVNGWGQVIFASAGEMVQNEKIKKAFDELPKVRAQKETEYSKKRKPKSIQEKPPVSPSSTTSPLPSPAAPPTPTPQSAQSATPASSVPPTPLDPSTNTNGSASSTLAPPPSSIDTESIASSDGELVSPLSPPGLPQTPKSASSSKGTPGKSAKKGKKRK